MSGPARTTLALAFLALAAITIASAGCFDWTVEPAPDAGTAPADAAAE